MIRRYWRRVKKGRVRYPTRRRHTTAPAENKEVHGDEKKEEK